METPPLQKKKASEMLLGVAHDYVSLGESLEETQNLLRSAASAWNIACMEESERGRMLKKYLKTFKKANPNATNGDLRAIKIRFKLSPTKEKGFIIDNEERYFERGTTGWLNLGSGNTSPVLLKDKDKLGATGGRNVSSYVYEAQCH